MNKFEKVVYNTVKKFPFLKSFVRDVYQGIMVMVSPPKSKKVTDNNVIEREGFFFGFHDKIPWSYDNSKLLAHRIKNVNSINSEGEIEIGYFHEDLETFEPLGVTSSWNWQQGSMLQWVNSEEIIFNVWDGKGNGARIIDLTGKVIRNLNYPVSVVSNCGQFALSFSFNRLGVGMPGYGYEHVDRGEDVSIQEPEDSGIYLYDYKGDTFKMLFSVKTIANYKREESMDGAYHFLTHTQFSPDSKRFLFLHRWQEGSSKRVNTRLLTSDLEGKDLYLLNSNGMVSHLTWFGGNKILAYASTKKYGDAYTIFTDKSEDVAILNPDEFNSDGHPQFCNNNGLIVSDTYPNRSRMQQLFLLDVAEQEKKVLGSFFSPLKYKETYRCDLHPRWDRLGNMICFDSVHTGVRSICVMKLKGE
ncbi:MULTISPECIES: hypothetical protein [Zobellia]|uniref:O antigen biosynthesis protein WbgV n=1 Tax=Zobellia galactanivorans (strain DSM 12802 / CCUG 47099 / CIP 106680 / NCIMB 13871 / Dsij) TaxID=63186 RepID=G0L4W3_ZOBGA|nr:MULTISPECIES: hypothetical protein [Zobellia]OWW26824.1 hypothetical protein B4Q04_03845 [Zobellia sp. OII3]CAZ95802.1 O antigen biosynthesis protein WbgV [Zobellia galactanivorans]